MPTKRSSAAVVLGVLVAVIAVVVGATAASGWRGSSTDESATGTTGRSNLSVAVPGPDAHADAQPDAQPEAASSLFDALPALPAAASDPAAAALAGDLVAQGADLRVEQVAVDATTTLYRVTISAGPYVMRDMPAIISADGSPLGIAAESVDLSSLVLWTDDAAVVTAGTEIALSYGLPGQAPVEWSTTIEVAS